MASTTRATSVCALTHVTHTARVSYVSRTHTQASASERVARRASESVDVLRVSKVYGKCGGTCAQAQVRVRVHAHTRSAVRW
jgi:hypothetical protein